VNSLLVFSDEFVAPNRVVLRGERAREVCREYQSREGFEITFAVWQGEKGTARLCSVTPTEIVMEVTQMEPSRPLELIDLVIGLSRPQTIKKVIQAAVMLGVRSLHLVRTEFGEKSYLTASLLEPINLKGEVFKALEQIGEGLSPMIHVHRSFSFFCRTHLDLLGQGGDPLRLIAQPGATELCPSHRLNAGRPIVLAIGPESGWSVDEVNQFAEHGFKPIGLGPRVIRVEIAVAFLLGQIRLLNG
jgi:16S rRNA (uracil1498-N3)-methyltransferase